MPEANVPPPRTPVAGIEGTEAAMRYKPLSAQTVVITGASSGIGRVTAKMAARQGACVVLAARNAEALEALAGEIREEGGVALVVPTDVADFGQVQRLADRAAEEFDGIDTWVNNAAVIEYGSFEQTPVEDFRRLFEVNVMGQVHGAKAALPHLRRTGGALVCVGSVASDRGVPLAAAYSASKHALKGWIDALRLELLHEGAAVRVTLIKPGSIDTPLFEHARTWLGVKPKGMAPIYAPELVADAILHAATHDDRDVYVGGFAKAMSLIERISPRMLDAQLRMTAFEGQRTNEVRDADAPHNLYAALPSDGGERGGAPGRVHERALFPWAHKRPWIMPLVSLAVFGLLMRRLRAPRAA